MTWPVSTLSPSVGALLGADRVPVRPGFSRSTHPSYANAAKNASASVSQRVAEMNLSISYTSRPRAILNAADGSPSFMKG